MSHLCDYGSEYHLLRYLGRHRAYLNARVLETTGADSIGWIDFHFDRRISMPDEEIKGLEFVEDPDVLEAWSEAWPGGCQSLEWDSVAQLYSGETPSFLLLDVCSSVDELDSSCQASNGNRDRIRATFDRTQMALDVSPDRDWMSHYFGLTSRLAALAYLRSRGIEAQLLRLYFVGDDHPRHACPQTPEDWKAALDAQAQHIGLPPAHPLSAKIHELFLPTCPLSGDEDR